MKFSVSGILLSFMLLRTGLILPSFLGNYSHGIEKYANFSLMMKKLISQKQANIILMALLSAVLVFHILVLTGVIPYGIIWAGKIGSLERMRELEVISIGVNVFVILILALKADYLRHKIPVRILNAIIWLLVVLFSLNTIGNLFAKSNFELFFFTPLTFISAILCLRIVVDKGKKADSLLNVQ